MINRLLNRWPLLILALALIVVFYRLFLGEVLFWALPALQFVPWRDFAFETLQAGHLPLWNPYNGAGAPLFANYQTELLYPLTWPGYVLPLAWSMSLTAVLHLFIAGWGMYAFTGRLGLPVLGRGVSAIAYGLSGYMVARLWVYPTITAAAWIPWVLWAVLGVLMYSQRRQVGVLALVVALQLLAGHAQTTWYSLLLAGLFALYWLAANRPAAWTQRLLLALTGMILAAGIAALQLLPTAELLLSSQRSGGVDYDFAMNFSYSPARALNFLNANVFGNPGVGTYITEGAYFEDAVYIGLLPLVAATAAVTGWIIRRFRKDPDEPAFFRTVPFWFAVALIAFLLALGSNFVLFPFLFNYVPTFNLFQAPVRWHIWTVFALSVLAGIGTQAWGRGYWLFFGTRLAVAGSIGAALLALFVLPSVLPADVYAESGVQVLLQAVVVTAILGAGCGTLTLLQPDAGTMRYTWWRLAVVVFVAFDLGFAAWGLNPTVPAAFFDRVLVDHHQRAYWPDDVEQDVTFDRFLDFQDYRLAADNWQDFRASELANLNLLDRWPLLNNFDPFQVGGLAQYIELVENHPERRDTLLQAAAVDAVYAEDGQRVPLGHAVARAWFVDEVCWYADVESLERALLADDWQPQRTALLLGEGDCESAAVGRVLSVMDVTPNRTIVQVDASDGGWLVLADTIYPGWQASTAGEALTLYTANGMFRAVQVPPGTDRVIFEYAPWWLPVGGLISLMALLVLVLLFRSRNPNESLTKAAVE